MLEFDDTNSIKIGSIDCFDLDTEETFDQFDSVATRKIACKWSERKSLIEALNPQGTSLGPVYLFQSIPYPDFPNMYPQRFRAKRYPGSQIVKAASGMVGFDMCELTVEYRPFRGGDAQGYLEFDLGCDVITMPGSGAWLESADSVDDNGKAVVLPLADCARGYPVPVIGVVRGRSNVAGLNVDKFAAIARNPINDGYFYGFPPGTVLFEGVRARRQTLTNAGSGVNGGPGNTNTDNPANLLGGAWDIECRFKARPALEWDYLPFHKRVGSTLQFVLEKVRLRNNAGPYLGRSNLNTLFT